MDWASMGLVGDLPPNMLKIANLALEKGWTPGGTTLVTRFCWPDSQLAFFARWDLRENLRWSFGGARFNMVTPDWSGQANQNDVRAIIEDPYRLIPKVESKRKWAWNSLKNG